MFSFNICFFKETEGVIYWGSNPEALCSWKQKKIDMNRSSTVLETVFCKCVMFSICYFLSLWKYQMSPSITTIFPFILFPVLHPLYESNGVSYFWINNFNMKWHWNKCSWQRTSSTSSTEAHFYFSEYGSLCNITWPIHTKKYVRR